MSIIKNITNILVKPQVALLILLIFIVCYIITIYFLGGFNADFVAFGPYKDKNGNDVSFAGMNLNTWKKVISVYFIILFSSILQVYYNNVITKSMQQDILNNALKKIPYTKFWTYFVSLVDPFIQIMLYVIKFFATATFQIQFIIPQLIGSYIANLPFTFKWLSNKQFI
jgi:hypothetical protein